MRKLESHRPRCRGSSKDKTSDARRIRPAQDKATTNHPILPALNPSSKVAACLVARTRMAGPEVRIYTRRVALRRSGATVCRPVGRLSKQNQEQSLENLLRVRPSPFSQNGHKITLFFSAPSVAVGGERAATSVRRLLNPARSLENGRSACWVAFQARSRHKLFRSRNFVRFLVRRVSTVSFLSRKSCSSWQVACEDAIEETQHGHWDGSNITQS